MANPSVFPPPLKVKLKVADVCVSGVFSPARQKQINPTQHLGLFKRIVVNS